MATMPEQEDYTDPGNESLQELSLDEHLHEELLRPEIHAGAPAGLEPQDLAKRPSRLGTVRVTCIDYSPDQAQVEEVLDIPAFLAAHRPSWSKVRWINVSGLTDMNVLRAFVEKYDLHPLLVEDMLTTQRPKVEDYPGSEERPGRLFVVARMLHLVGTHLASRQICFCLGRSTLLSFEEAGGEVFDPIRQRIATPGSRLRRNDVSFLLYALLDTIIDHLFPVLEAYSERLEQLERVVLTRPTQAILLKIHRVKRDLAVLRRGTWPMRELIQQMRREAHVCISEETQTYFRDIYDHVILVTELIETYRDFVSGLTELYMSSVSIKMNEIMKILTIISTIFVPLTFLAGVYGMNMPIPENASPWMYPIFWVIVVTVIAGMLFWFKRRGWF